MKVLNSKPGHKKYQLVPDAPSLPLHLPQGLTWNLGTMYV